MVPYTVATDMDAPNPDSGEEWFHTNTQLFGVLDEHNRFKIGEEVTAPWNAPPAGATPTMDGFVTDYISTFTGEMGRQPTYDEYAQIMTGYTPEQLPVLNGIAREFGVFDHWFSRGAVADVHEPLLLDGGDIVRDRREQPGEEVVLEERRGDDLRAAGAARQDVEDLRDGADAGVVPRRHPLLPPEGAAGDERRAVRRVREGRSRRNAARLLADRAELRRRARRLPPCVRSLARRSVDAETLDPPSSMLGGEAFLARIFDATAPAPRSQDRTSGTPRC